MNHPDAFDSSALDELIDADNFVDFVGEQLHDYAAGDAARTVLDRIRTEYLNYWTIPEGENS